MLPENVLQKLLGDVSFSDCSKDISKKREKAKKSIFSSSRDEFGHSSFTSCIIKKEIIHDHSIQQLSSYYSEIFRYF